MTRTWIPSPLPPHDAPALPPGTADRARSQPRGDMSGRELVALSDAGTSPSLAPTGTPGEMPPSGARPHTGTLIPDGRWDGGGSRRRRLPVRRRRAATPVRTDDRVQQKPAA